MTPFQIFKIGQAGLGRKYRGKLSDFQSADYYPFYCHVRDFLYEKFGSNENTQRNYLNFCINHFGDRFSPFNLDSEEYLKLFEEHQKTQIKSKQEYFEVVAKNIKFIDDFCKKQGIFNLNDYKQQWGVTHFLAEKLNENVAFFIGLHEINMTVPEKKILRKKFLSKVSLIEERLHREPELRSLLERSVKVLKDNLRIYKARSQTN